MIVALIGLIQIAVVAPGSGPWSAATLTSGPLVAAQVAKPDSIPTVTLEQALRAAARLDPNYVASLGEVDNAEWNRRAAWSVFVLPSVSVQTSLTKFSNQGFNIGTGSLATQIVQGTIDARYDLFQGGAKLFELSRARAEVESARASELQARFNTAVLTESDYYDVLAQKELTRVAAERVRRAEEQLAVARARVVSGAAVRTDSLQLLLELTRARVDLLRQGASLAVAQVQLGRRVGIAGPVDAVELDSDPAPELPLSQDSAVAEAAARGPLFRVALAEEKAASAAFKAEWGGFMPQVTLFGQYQGFDQTFLPDAFTRTVWGFQVSLPVWNGGQREIALTRARTSRDAARAAMRDAQLAVQRDAIEAYQNYVTARASTELAQQSVVVARENLEVQNNRYRAGATTILDLLAAQVAMSEAEAGLVQARYATRLALAGLEAIIGRRLFTDKGI